MAAIRQAYSLQPITISKLAYMAALDNRPVSKELDTIIDEAFTHRCLAVNVNPAHKAEELKNA